MASRPDIRASIFLPPDDTRRAFDARGDLRTTVRWHDMWQGEHARAFTVAKLANLDLLDTIRNSLADALANGATFEQWKERILPDLQRAGWWGRVQDAALTGTDRAVYIGPRRLETIYRTNLRVSRAAGQWARIQERKAVAPYLRYSAVMDARTRPLHRQWHGTILPVDHEWWNEHYPPCGWNCRCTVMQLSERDLRDAGWTVSARPPPGGMPRSFWRAGTDTPERVPAGIDPGWAYNPGAESRAAIVEKAEGMLNRIAAIDPEDAIRRMRWFARDPSVDFAVTIGRAAGESRPDIAGFARQIGVSEVRHAIRRHGPGRDPWPVTDDDFLLIPRIIREGRRVDQETATTAEQVFILLIDALYYVYVERIGRKRGERVRMRTLFKNPVLPVKYRGGEG